ncbi:MAG: ABC transporter substrate-binding protein [Acidobacteriota bacterium]
MPRFSRMFMACLLTLSLLLSPVMAARSANSGSSTNILAPGLKDGHKYRIAYCESEPYVNYAGTLYALIKGFGKLGWLDARGLPYAKGQSDTTAMWDYLTAHNSSPYIDFVKDGNYSLSTMPSANPENLIIRRLKEKGDIDLVICMGTKAGKILAQGKHKVPVAVFSTSNAVRAGIVKSASDSGCDNIWAHVDPARYQTQIEVFHDIFKFKKLGLVHEDSETGRILAAVDDVKKVARTEEFKIIGYGIKEPINDADQERYYHDLLKLHKKLAGEVDAMYLTMGQIEADRLPEMLAPFYEKDIPVFSQLGSEEVANGALLSVAQASYNQVGEYGAEVMIKLLRGMSARQLAQSFQSTPNIALNLDVAERIGYKPSFEILLAADEIYSVHNKK